MSRLVDIYGTEVTPRRRLSPSLSHPIVESAQHIISPLSVALLSWGVGRVAVLPQMRTFFAARRAARMHTSPPPPPPPTSSSSSSSSFSSPSIAAASTTRAAAAPRRSDAKFRSNVKFRSFSSLASPPPPSPPPSLPPSLPSMEPKVARFAEYWDATSYLDVLHHLSNLWLPVKIESLLMQLHENTGLSW